LNRAAKQLASRDDVRVRKLGDDHRPQDNRIRVLNQPIQPQQSDCGNLRQVA
jgi:hypothetical protein